MLCDAKFEYYTVNINLTSYLVIKLQYLNDHLGEVQDFEYKKLLLAADLLFTCLSAGANLPMCGDSGRQFCM